MTESNQTTAPRRVLVALEADEEATVLLEAAASLAAGLQAELVGLFVEDSELLDAAALPVTYSTPRHVPAQAETRRPIDARVMQRALKISSAKAAIVLERAAERRQVKCSYRVVRGHMEEQVLAEVRSQDLLALGAPSKVVRRSRLARASRSVVERAPCPVLLMQAAGGFDRPVTVVYDGSQRALELGRRLARIYERPLGVLAVGESETTAAALEQEAASWLGSHRVAARLRAQSVDSTEEICAALRNEQPATLVLDPQGGLSRRFGLEAVLGGLKCSALALA